MSPHPVVISDALSRYFGDFLAVDNVNFTIKSGEIVGYLGPNGCGKTTTIRMLLGLLKPSSGKATVLGFDAFRESEEVRSRAGYMSQRFALYDDLSVMENMTFYAGVYGIRARSSLMETIEMAGLAEHKNVVVRSLSAGWRQRLALGIALVHHPELLFLDEPTSGVDPNARRVFWDLIYGLTRAGVTVLVTTHYMDEAEYCDRVGIMRAGRLLAMDTPAALKKDFIQGDVWEIQIENKETMLGEFAKMDGVLRVSLAGDHLRLVLAHGTHPDHLVGGIVSSGKGSMIAQPGEPTLEDVFISLAKD